MSREARGYGKRHRKLRAALAPQVEAGEAVCWRCQKLIVPGTPWDLGHDDNDRSVYRGPEHRKCNRRAGGRQGAKVTNRGRGMVRRDW